MVQKGKLSAGSRCWPDCPTPDPLSIVDDFSHAPHPTIFKANLDAVRMIGRVGQHLLNNAVGTATRALVGFEDN